MGWGLTLRCIEEGGCPSVAAVHIRKCTNEKYTGTVIVPFICTAFEFGHSGIRPILGLHPPSP